jgi:hypothetical protein
MPPSSSVLESASSMADMMALFPVPVIQVKKMGLRPS